MRPNGNSREHWSASSLRELCSCPMRYRLHRVDGCRPTHRSPGLVLGSTYHEAIANALIALHQGKAVEADDLAQSFESAWAGELKREGPPIRWTDRSTAEKQKELGLRLVGAWYDQGLKLFADTEIVAVELPFTVPIVSSEGEVLERPLTGYIDAVVRTPDGRTIVIDHKTAAQNFSDAELELDLQVTAYLHAARELGHGECEFRFHAMSKGKKPVLTVLPAERTARDLDRLFSVARDAERLITAGIFLPKSPDWMCASCPYLRACREALTTAPTAAREAVPAA